MPYGRWLPTSTGFSCGKAYSHRREIATCQRRPAFIAAPSAADHRQPGGEIIVIRDAGDFAFADFEERADAEMVFLSIRLRQSLVGGEVFAADEKLRSGARWVVAGEHHEILDGFPIATVHALEERAERVLAGLDAAFVDFVDHVVREQFEQRLAVALVEGGVVGFDQGFHGSPMMCSILANPARGAIGKVAEEWAGSRYEVG